jgi:septation ring formation regulator EzrA
MKIRYRQDKVQAQLVAAREELDSMMNKQSTLKTQVIELQEKIRILDKNLENLEMLEQNAMKEIRVLEDQQIEARKGRPFVSHAISEAAREIHLPPVPSPSHVDGAEQQEGVSQISSPIPAQHLEEGEHISSEPEHLQADRAQVQDVESEDDFAAWKSLDTPEESKDSDKDKETAEKEIQSPSRGPGMH